MRQKFKKLRTSSIKSCECIHTWLVKLQGEIEALECYAENHNTMNHFAFDRLQKVATEISGKISTFRNELPSLNHILTLFKKNTKYCISNNKINNNYKCLVPFLIQ